MSAGLNVAMLEAMVARVAMLEAMVARVAMLEAMVARVRGDQVFKATTFRA